MGPPTLRKVTPLALRRISEVMAGHVDASDSASAALRATAAWVRDFLAQGHRSIGRSGTVCPYVPQALELDSIRLAAIRGSRPSVAEVDALVDSCREYLRGDSPESGQRRLDLFRAVLVVFVDVTAEDASDVVDASQWRLKPAVVRDGLMIGEFHARNRTPGLHAPDFFPLRSPHPLLALRWMVESDVVFLGRPEEPPDRRAAFLESFLRVLGPRLSAEARRAAEGLLETAVAQADSRGRGEVA